MRDRFNAPIVFDRDHGGYRFDKQGVGPAYQLPGMWFSEEEAVALVTMGELLSRLDPGGLLAEHIDPLLSHIDAILGGGKVSAEELRKRIKITSAGIRLSGSQFFQKVGVALLERRRMWVRFYSRASDEVTERVVSPQRLVFYRQNWYLDAYCHLRNGLRSFALDGIQSLDTKPEPAVDIDQSEIESFFSGGYGIFSGGAEPKWARLKFTRERARWVASERWHSKQITSIQTDGTYLLEFPYHDDRELVGDILRHGPDVEVLEPSELRSRVAEKLALANVQYL